jgi:hypothetical protein
VDRGVSCSEDKGKIHQAGRSGCGDEEHRVLRRSIHIDSDKVHAAPLLRGFRGVLVYRTVNCTVDNISLVLSDGYHERPLKSLYPRVALAACLVIEWRPPQMRGQ